MKKEQKNSNSKKLFSNKFKFVLLIITVLLTIAGGGLLTIFNFNTNNQNKIDPSSSIRISSATDLIDLATIDKGGGSISFSVQDYVYFPSYNEVNSTYGLTTNADRLLMPTDWSLANNAYLNTSYAGMGNIRSNDGVCEWLCRSAYSNTMVRGMSFSGLVTRGSPDGESGASRCALHLNLGSSISALGAGSASLNILTHNGKTYHTITLSSLMWPQTKVNATTESALISELNSIKNNSAYKTGRVYVGRTTNITSTSKTIMGEGNTASATGGCEEYYYKNNYYTLVPQYADSTSYTYSDGSSVADKGASSVWIKVEPIKWVINNWSAMPTSINSSGKGTATYIDAYSVYGIVSGFYFYPNSSDTNRTSWTSSCWRAYLNGYDLNEKSDSNMANIKANFKGQGFLDTVYHDLRTKVTKPTLKTNSVSYTGSNITITSSTYCNNFDSTTMNVTNNVKKDVGNYSVTFSLKDTANYVWKDGTDTSFSLSWSITQAAVAKPTNLAVSTAGVLTFNAVTNATGYQYKIGSGSYSATTTSRSINLFDSLVANATAKTVYVRAVSSGNYKTGSAASVVVNFNTISLSAGTGGTVNATSRIMIANSDIATSSNVIKFAGKQNVTATANTGYTFSGWSYNLSSGYTQVGYIQATGAQFIDTGLNADPNTRVVMSLKFTSTAVQQRMFSTNDGGTGGFRYDSYINGNGYYAFAFKNDSGNWISTAVTATTTDTILVDLDGKSKKYKLYLNDSATATKTIDMSSYAATQTSTNKIRLLSSGNGSYANAYVYYCRIYQNGSLVRNFVPCKNSSNVYGLFDTVNNTFYKSGSSTAFSGGGSGNISTIKGFVGTFNCSLRANFTANALTMSNTSITKTFSTSKQTASINTASNGTGNYSYAITAGNTGSYFSLSGTTLTIKASTPALSSYSLIVRATDGTSGVTKDATVTVTINRAKVTTEPSVTADLTFNTLTQSPTISFDTSKCRTTDESITSAVHAGTYTITIEIIDKTNYEFNDGTQSKQFSWTIQRFNIGDATIGLS